MAVVLDFGAASPMSILAAARGLTDVVFLCDRNLSYVRAMADDLGDIATVCDITDLDEAAVLDRIEHLDLDGVTTFSESQLNHTAALAHGRGWAFLSPPAAEALTDKFTQRRILAEAGVQATRCRVVRAVADLDTALAEVGLPAILKPRSGAASAYTCRVDTLAEAAARLQDFLARIPASSRGDFPASSRGDFPASSRGDFVVEEILLGDPSVAGAGWGDYVSVESATSDGVVRHVEITGKFPLAPPLRETGYFVPSTLAPAVRQQVLDLTEAGILALGMRHGVTHVEVKLTPAGPRIIEINGRLGGYVADIIRRARRFDLVRAALTVALGRPVDVPPAGYRRYAFQYFITPPMDAVALRRLDGVDELSRYPGIHLVEIFKAAGQHLDWRNGTLVYLGIVHGSARDHEGVASLIDLVDKTLEITYEMISEDGTG